MRKLMIAVALAATLAACGGGSGGKTTSVSLSTPNASASHPSGPTSSTGSTPSVNPTPTYRYPAAIQSALMARCRRTGSRSACVCVLRYFEGNFSYAQLTAASVPRLANWATKAASVCSGA